MKVELVDVATDDGIALTGALLEPRQGSDEEGVGDPHQDVGTSRVPGVDMVLMLHGNGGNFYGPFYRYFAEQLARLGCATLRVNSRGHDVVSRAVAARGTAAGPESPGGDASADVGTALENMDDCRRDWRAWIDFAWHRGYRDILIWGHSRGAVKTAYYLSVEGDPRVKYAIIASPPWFSYSRWMRSRHADRFASHLSEARRLVDSGQPDALIRATVPMGYLCGAASYLDTYGPEEKYNVITHIAKVTCPVLAITGGAEVVDLFPLGGVPEALAEVGERKPDLTHVSVPDGDHMYTGKQEYVLDQVLRWLRDQ